MLFRKRKLKKWYEHNVAGKDFPSNLWRLEDQKAVLVFMYCDAQHTCKWNKVLGSYLTVHAAFTDESFSMFRGENCVIPLRKGFTQVPLLKIRGHVYSIRPYQLEELDKYKDNGVKFKRERVVVSIPYRWQVWTAENGKVSLPLQVQYIKAWMYVGVDEYWLSRIDNGYNFRKVWQAEEYEFKYYYYGSWEYELPPF